MKRSILILTIILMALFALPIFAEPITANTVAVAEAPAWYETLISKFLPPLIEMLLGVFAGWFFGIFDAIAKYTAKSKYGQEVGILVMSLKLAIQNKAKKEGKHYSEMLSELIRMVSDLDIDPEEKKRLLAMRDEIKADAATIAHESFKELRGWSKDKGSKYIADRIDLLLGELESHLFDSKKN